MVPCEWDDAAGNSRRERIQDHRFLPFHFHGHRPHGFEIRESEKTSRHADKRKSRGMHAGGSGRGDRRGSGQAAGPHTASSGRAGAGPAVPRPGAGDGDPETGSRGGHGAS